MGCADRPSVVISDVHGSLLRLRFLQELESAGG
ncbi:hypothetical protein KPSA3_03915 [Pseudomonas syringae pv. actinidiae]|uniref:Uncharacterized protein n=1 Tax=Pseudomonas syringae pv. actinidiae TaxID=103796 RepID=A0AAN4Q5U9_PSESF|nr:hypothetical protein KPSA3_03915 [Pseudomonas syringae pv. actinidiae]